MFYEIWNVPSVFSLYLILLPPPCLTALLNVSFTLQKALNLMNRIIFEVALKPGAAESNGRVWSTVRGENVFSIYTKVSRCQILPT